MAGVLRIWADCCSALQLFTGTCKAGVSGSCGERSFSDNTLKLYWISLLLKDIFPISSHNLLKASKKRACFHLISACSTCILSRLWEKVRLMDLISSTIWSWQACSACRLLSRLESEDEYLAFRFLLSVSRWSCGGTWAPLTRAWVSGGRSWSWAGVEWTEVGAASWTWNWKAPGKACGGGGESDFSRAWLRSGRAEQGWLTRIGRPQPCSLM